MADVAGVAPVRRPVFRLIYEQKDITTDVAPYVRSVTYTDYISGQSDLVEVEFDNVDGRWLNSWYPEKGDRLVLKLGYEGEDLHNCGSFEIDEIEPSGPPDIVIVRGLATGLRVSLRTRRSEAHDNTTLEAIAKKIAKRHGLRLVGTIRKIPIDRAAQYQERDLEFLTRVATDYGYAFKVAGNDLVFWEHANLRSRPPVADLVRQDLRTYSVRDKIKDVYLNGHGRYQDPKTKQLIVVGVNAGEVGVVGHTTVVKQRRRGEVASGDSLIVASRAPTKATAERKVRAALDAANLELTTGTLEVEGNVRLLAGSTVSLALGKLSGTYLIDSARHRLDRGGGYRTEVEIRQVAAATIAT